MSTYYPFIRCDGWVNLIATDGEPIWTVVEMPEPGGFTDVSAHEVLKRRRFLRANVTTSYGNAVVYVEEGAKLLLAGRAIIENTRLRAENERLRAALAPLATSDCHSFGCAHLDGDDEPCDIQAARAALAETSKEPKP